VIGEGDRAHAVASRGVSEIVGSVGCIQKTVVGVDVEMNELGGHQADLTER
jgi:hypothetical protein